MMPLLTIGMPCYNDYSGAWFTVQALRMQIQERTEILVVDTFGDDRLKKFVEQDCRCSYVRAIEPQGTAPAKNHVFAHANGKFVLCLDSHVLLMPGSLQALVEYLDAHQDFDGLGYGPLIYDNLRDAVCAMKPVWRGHMWGIWGDYQRIETLPSEPFEIWGHGGGCFVAKRDAWLGFNLRFRGFGGEEGYLPEKYRKHGKKVLCFPWLRWAHRFGPATGYRLDIDDRIRNYLIGMEELALDTKPVYDHFGEAATSKVAENLKGITVKSFNGIGDLLYATPSFEAIKKRHPLRRIVVNTNHRWLLEGNPHVDAIGSDDSGVFLGYPDVIHCQRPVQHHILTDWEIICKQYNLVTDKPQLRPRIHFEMPPRRGGVLVQVIDKGSWHGKKTWPHAQKFSDTYGFAAIPKFEDQKDLVRCIATAQLVVCMEGGIHHIAAAVGTPAIVILPAFTDSSWVGYDGQKYIGRPCELKESCYNPEPCRHKIKNQCMDVSIGEVYEAVMEAIKQPIRLFPDKKKLNLGSGDMLLKDYVNFDAQAFKRNGLATDSFGRIEFARKIFGEGVFDEILCAHVIEHFQEPDALRVLGDIYAMLKTNGKAIIEGPDFLGAQRLAGTDTRKAIRWITSQLSDHPKKWGDRWIHRSAWTKEIIAEEMRIVGFEIVHIGIGLTHGMGERDFRVEGIKRA